MLITYNIPGGQELQSPDYSVTVSCGGEIQDSFVYYNCRQRQYIKFNENGSVLSIKNMTGHNGPRRHSHTIFSFDSPVTIRVTVNEAARHISLPLKSAKILPSSYHIPCKIENGNTIVFTLDRPEKVAVIPNYDQVWNDFKEMAENHTPIQCWEADYEQEAKKESYGGERFSEALAEGYDNPLFISALPLEVDVPDTSKENTLFVNPGDKVQEEEMLSYDVVWFKPGIHDLSAMGYAPFFHTRVKRGQTVYLEGGAYVYARFKRFHDKEAGSASIIGRGVISGLKHTWIHSFQLASQIIDIDNLIGVTVTDRAGFSIYNSRLIKDVTLLGAWHGNNDGPDYSDNTVIENCFLLAHDDNLKINHKTHAKHIVIWQGANAHAIMVKETFRSISEFSDSVVEDVDIITCFQDPKIRSDQWSRHGSGAIACVTALPMVIRNFTFRNIRIESPYLYRIFNITNLNTNNVNPGWFMCTTEEKHTRIDGMHFENIQITSPLIAYRSKIGSDYDHSLNNLTFDSIVIQGTAMTEENKDTFMEIQQNKVSELTFKA